MNLNQKYLQIALKATKISSPIFKKYFGKVKEVEMKNQDPSDLVTAIDKKIELLIRKIILKNFPTHKIIGEEFEKDQVGEKDLVWVLDPIDGTTNFVHGLPVCCISIGLWDKNGPLVSVVCNPILNQTYSAIRGRGAFLNGKEVSVSKVQPLKKAMGCLGWGKEKSGATQLFSEFTTDCFKIRILASCTWQMCIVASGNTDFFISVHENPWDFAAAALIVKEAGGQVTDFENKELKLQITKIIASNGKIHQELLKKLSK